MSQISDNFPQFLVIKNTTVYYRHCTLFQYDYSKFVESSFINDFTGLSWDFLNETNLNTNSKFDTVYDKVHETAITHLPLKKVTTRQLKLRSKPWIDSHIPGFSLGRLHMGRLLPPYGGGGGASAGDKALLERLMRRGHRPYGRDLTLIDYIIN